jgi:hypothetical protein
MAERSQFAMDAATPVRRSARSLSAPPNTAVPSV